MPLKLSKNFLFFSFSGLLFARLVTDGTAGFASRLTSASAFAASDNRFLCSNSYGFNSLHNLPPYNKPTDSRPTDFLCSLYTNANDKTINYRLFF